MDDIKDDIDPALSSPLTTPSNSRTNSLRRQTSSASKKFNFLLSGIRKRSPNDTPSPSECPGDFSPDNLSITTSSDEKENNGNFNKGNMVTIVLVEAKGLPSPPDDGASHVIYGKIKLGNNVAKSKVVPHTRQPQWKQRFKFYVQNSSVLQLAFWDKGKQKTFMGCCNLDLANLESDYTHELWLKLDDGFGSVHLSATMCTMGLDNNYMGKPQRSLQDESYFMWNDFRKDIVGRLYVKVLEARGWQGKVNAHCILELDNQRIQTCDSGNSEQPSWNKEYFLDIQDITSTLDITLYSSGPKAFVPLVDNFLGKVSIPLMQINSRELRWFALKDRSLRVGSKGQCPRILLELNMAWNPVKATMRLFRPIKEKYIKKPKKFDVFLVYSNMEFIRDTFLFLRKLNDFLIRLFEWDNKHFSALMLSLWITFWYFFEIWMFPLLLLIPFVIYAMMVSGEDMPAVNDLLQIKDDNEKEKQGTVDLSLVGHIQGLPEMTLTITDGIDYMVSIAHRLYNLVSFKAPFLSCVTMVLLVVSSVVLYCVPFNYLLIAFGIFKFVRKYSDPQREYNNDLLDFIFHVPDNDKLEKWKELRVPEPEQVTRLPSPLR